MVSSIVSILVLATAVLAHPKRHHHFHHGTGTGTGGVAFPTGGTYPLNGTDSTNGTDFAGSALSSTALSTVTVSPLPASTSDVLSSVSAVDAAVAAESSTTSCTSSSTSTITTTTVQFVTVTSASISSSASEVLIVSDSSSSASATQGTQAAAAFYGKGGHSFTYTAAGASSAAQTSAEASSVSSAVATTFATVASSAAASSAASTTESSASSTATSTSSSSSSSSGKKGLSYNTASLTDAFAGKDISWAYNWGNAADGSIVSGAEYVPMLWGLDAVDDWASAAASAISSGSEHALSFNEPDLSSQSNIDPATAATNHIKYMNPLSGQVQIGSPAVTNGVGTSPPLGTTWLSQFFEACNGECDVDFVAFHWYGTSISDFESHVQDVISTASSNGVSKVWLTEFGATGSDSDVADFLTQAVAYLDSQSAVERYAYFMCSDGILVDGSSVSSPIGEAYLG
ncbi:glycosyl hydrolase catalytic core-domain-containing protein [Exophiala viscosa]|uniref:Glycosyl hydrolase catalytic core-domain-containing protein n=1 Tax=Exophiala viscosa TaxID=2486360 RepID=A0AAN6IAK2_9EURO|nr:glycosyl hydrolase catalytic core-domain-containing protein [Exophiala viscosa]